MRICWFGTGSLGLLEGPIIRDVTAALDILPVHSYPFPEHDLFIANLEQILERVRQVARTAKTIPLEQVTLLSPIANPGKIICAPVNYQKHLREAQTDPQLHHGNLAHTITIQQAGLFLKATSALVGPGEGVALRHTDRRNDHEIELAVVIGQRASKVSQADALCCVAGYSIGLDITIRGSEDRSFRKSPDSYAVLGPCLVTADEIPNPGALDLSITVNGDERQNSNTKYMILGVPELIELASSFYTLYPGDIIMTGTPEGVSPIVPGDTIVAAIERIGSMQVKVGEFS